ncbi:MAG TPA: PBP1A family penicillin-binding protein [Vicinamibacterales bacterium]|nr:PBP1A family penicillin-binding protein [Vicinamibacterales bacterium]
MARRAGIAALFILMALLGSLGGVFFAYANDVAEVSALDNYKPNTITRLLASNGDQIGEFATERRVVIGYDDIAPALRQAIIASEDGDFERHFGINLSRLAVTAVRDLVTGQRYGASTITQQVARILFLQQYMRGGVFARSGVAGWERKLKEAMLAFQLEKRYTKREIFAFYANHIPLGHGAYGVEAAARMYFDKSAKDVTLEEAAAIAAIVQTPARLSPFVNPKANMSRRNNYVLPRMVAEGFITKEQAADAGSRPLVLQGQPTPEQSNAPYFVEDIRKMLEQKYGADTLYQAGLRVQTTLDVKLQEAANAAVDRGLRALDKRRNGYRRPRRNILAEGKTLDTFTTERWSEPILAGDIVPAVVSHVPTNAKESVRVRIGRDEVDLPRAGYAWTGKASAATLFKVGDLIEVGVRSLANKRPTVIVLEQPPAVEGALIAIDNHTGQIRAMVGGFSFARSKFNRATQARRQVGSLFKPFVYTAAIDRGFTPISIFIDEPVSYEVGANQPLYEPLNYDRKFEGSVTLRHALEDSRNIPAVKAMAEVGPAEVVGYAKRFGLRGDYQPYLSLALGAAEATLVEMTSAYTAFANRGVRMEPYSVVTIADREGNILDEHRPEPHEALRADTAFVMTNLLRGVVQRGTAEAAKSLDWPLAGKTGTMDEYTDAWFIGFDPDITVGVWVGYDEKKPLGSGETGAVAALPIWMDFMKVYIQGHGDRRNPPRFEAPGNIVFVTLESGNTEAFINGTQPEDVPQPTPAVTATSDSPPLEQ